MFRKDLKVLDCTIRDGGLINNYQFSEDFVKAVYAALCESGVDVIELGKKLVESDEYPRAKYGPWNFCDEDVLKRVVESYKGNCHPEIAVDVAGSWIGMQVRSSPSKRAAIACEVACTGRGH